jgi:hypothetical protein
MFSIKITSRFIKTFTVVFFTLGIALSVSAQKGKARAFFLSMDQTKVTPGNENGYDFKKLKFMYQFRACGKEVQLGIAYDKKATFTRYWKDGKSYTKSEVGAKNWPKSEDIRLNEATADLFFGSRKLGTVTLDYIPEFYQGCSGRMFNVLKSLGIDPSERVYKTNIDKLRLGNIRLTKATIKSE